MTEKEAIRMWIRKTRRDLGCQGCDSTKHLVFHHVVPELKLFELNNPWKHSREEIAHEMSKCQVLCGSCHGRVHCSGSERGVYFVYGSYTYRQGELYRKFVGQARLAFLARTLQVVSRCRF